MPNIFLSYRRSDSQPYIGRIVDRLELAGFTIFYDLDKITPGAKWRDVIRESVAISDVLVAVIGKAWLSERLHDENDPVLMEVTLAIDLGKPVLPLLLDRCPFPDAASLPPTLDRLQQFNAAHLDTEDPNFNDHIRRLIASLKRLICFESEGLPTSAPHPREFKAPRPVVTFESRIEQVRQAKEQAIKMMDFDKAAALRDEERAILKEIGQMNSFTPSVLHAEERKMFQENMHNFKLNPTSFTPSAQITIALAYKEAEHMQSSIITTAHLLLGMLKLEKGICLNVLRNCGVNLNTAQTQIKRLIGQDTIETELNDSFTKPKTWTPRFKKVLALAREEAGCAGRPYVGTESILMGILIEGGGVAAEVLKQNGLEIERTRSEIERELSPP